MAAKKQPARKRRAPTAKSTREAPNPPAFLGSNLYNILIALTCVLIVVGFQTCQYRAKQREAAEEYERRKASEDRGQQTTGRRKNIFQTEAETHRYTDTHGHAKASPPIVFSPPPSKARSESVTDGYATVAGRLIPSTQLFDKTTHRYFGIVTDLKGGKVEVLLAEGADLRGSKLTARSSWYDRDYITSNFVTK